MVLVEGNGCFNSGARFEHFLIATNFRQRGIRVPLLIPAGQPIAGQTFGIHSALGPAVIVTDKDAAVMVRAGGSEPNPGFSIWAILVVAEQDPICIGEHEHCAGRHLNCRKAERQPGEKRSHHNYVGFNTDYITTVQAINRAFNRCNSFNYRNFQAKTSYGSASGKAAFTGQILVGGELGHLQR